MARGASHMIASFFAHRSRAMLELDENVLCARVHLSDEFARGAIAVSLPLCSAEVGVNVRCRKGGVKRHDGLPRGSAATQHGYRAIKMKGPARKGMRPLRVPDLDGNGWRTLWLDSGRSDADTSVCGQRQGKHTRGARNSDSAHGARLRTHEDGLRRRRRNNGQHFRRRKNVSISVVLGAQKR